MTENEPLRVGAYGFTFGLTLTDADGNPLDVSGATTLQLILERPDSSTVTKTAALETTGLDGRVVYLVAPGDLNQAGEWRRQFKVVTPQMAPSIEPVAFEVLANIV